MSVCSIGNRSWLLSWSKVAVENVLLDGIAVKKVFLIDAVKPLPVHLMIPDTVRVDYEDRPVEADTQATTGDVSNPLWIAKPVHAVFAVECAQLLKQRLYSFGRCTVAIGANKKVSPVGWNARDHLSHESSAHLLQ